MPGQDVTPYDAIVYRRLARALGSDGTAVSDLFDDLQGLMALNTGRQQDMIDSGVTPVDPMQSQAFDLMGTSTGTPGLFSLPSMTASGWEVGCGVRQNFDTVQFYLYPGDGTKMPRFVRLQIIDTDNGNAVLADVIGVLPQPLRYLEGTLVTLNLGLAIANALAHNLAIVFMTDGVTGVRSIVETASFTANRLYATGANLTTFPSLSGGSGAFWVRFSRSSVGSVGTPGQNGASPSLPLSSNNFLIQTPPAESVSTFSGWGGPVGVQGPFNQLLLAIIPWDSTLLPTKCRLQIYDTNTSGTLLADVTLSNLNLTGGVPNILPFNFPTINDTNPLFVQWNTDGHAGAVYLAIGAFPTASGYPSVVYFTDHSAAFSAPSTSGSQISPWCQFNLVSNQVPRVYQPADVQNDLLNALVRGAPSKILLPANLYAIQGQESRIYFQNILKSDLLEFGIPPGVVQWDLLCQYTGGNNVGKQLSDCWYFKPTSGQVGTQTYTLTAYAFGRKIAQKVGSLVVKSNTAPASGRKYLMIGDSRNDPVGNTVSGDNLSELINLGARLGSGWTITEVGTRTGSSTSSTGTYADAGSDGNGTSSTSRQVNSEGYSGQTIAFFDTYGGGAVGTAVMTGSGSAKTLASVTNTTAGTGLTTAPVAQVVPTGGDTPSGTATVTATVSGGAITGWTVTNAGGGYTNTPLIAINQNPFWFSAAFNFATYLTTNSITLSSGDWVVIDLGVNDLFLMASDVQAQAAIELMLTRLAAMIGTGGSPVASSIRGAVSGIRVGVMITPPPAGTQDPFGLVYGDNNVGIISRFRYYRYIRMWQDRLIGWLDTQNANNIFAIPVHAYIDVINGAQNDGGSAANYYAQGVTVTRLNNALHYAKSGFDQYAAGVIAFLRGQET